MRALCPTLASVLLAVCVGVQAANTSDTVYDLDDLKVGITDSMPYVELPAKQGKILLMRHQDPAHRVDPPYDKTSRDCPPYCVQPMRLAPGVETIGELELIDYLKRSAAGEPVLVIDSRTPSWTSRGMIPGAIAIPYSKLDPATANPAEVAETMELDFGAVRVNGLWSFGSAKTLVFYCNGPWCGQSPTNIRAMLDYGYPPQKIKWYRGGMQDWESLGFTTVKPPATAKDDEDGKGAHP
jgi:rhodanese-related sulfurtransferase